ncbi:hypothetical protein GCM10023116_18910 [Kistimonas scapharcae]|uniref:Uncharacterized protein n=1 Tax=Kistimonas scapharcae TaxID=1036133 RepID=A0ABP8V133_9GAMM
MDVLARLHGKNEEAKQKATNVTINQQNITNNNGDLKAVKKKMQSMSDEELLSFVGQNTSLDPQPLTIEGEVVQDDVQGEDV